MDNGGLNASDVAILTGLAEMLLNTGCDRAADLIYAAVEADEEAARTTAAPDWREAFAG